MDTTMPAAAAHLHEINEAEMTTTQIADMRGAIPQSIEAIAHELTPRQSTYVKRLSQITGREIVPIDLDLYRELLKLELIIDKGRRLALTKLGKEVAAALV